MDLVIPNHIADGGSYGHDLKCRNHLSVYGGDKLLRNDGIQHSGKLDGNLPLLVRRKHVDDPVDGIGRPDGVQGGQQKMPGFGRGHGHIDGLIVTHFPKQDHVRALPKRCPEGNYIIFRIHIDLPLADDAPPMTVQIFQGIFQGDDVGVPILVDAVNDTGQGGGFSAACGACD